MSLVEAADAAAQTIRAWPADAPIRIVADHDPDGVAASAVLAVALARLGRKFHVRNTWDRDQGVLDAATTPEHDPVAILDLGAAMMDKLARVAPRGVVIDHHPPGPPPADGWAAVNPWDHDMDGTRDACAATTTLAVAISLDPANWDQAATALVGAYGDRQHVNGFAGWNQAIIDEARQRHTIGWDVGLNLPDQPLGTTFAKPTHTLARILGADATRWLAEAGIDHGLRPNTLDPTRRQLLASRLAVEGVAAGVAAQHITGLVRAGPTHPRLGSMPVGHLARLVEASTRRNDAGTPLAVLMGDHKALAMLEEHALAFETEMTDAVETVMKSMQPRAGYLLALLEHPRLVGACAGAAMDRTDEAVQPIIVAAPTKDRWVFSARAPAAWVQSGGDLGRILSESSHALGGAGGGHAVAAGCWVPTTAKEDLLDRLDQACTPEATQ